MMMADMNVWGYLAMVGGTLAGATLLASLWAATIQWIRATKNRGERFLVLMMAVSLTLLGIGFAGAMLRLP